MELTGNVQGMIDLLGGGSDVEVEQILESGEKIAVITVDDVPTDIYAPEVSVTPIQESGTKIATVTVDDVPTDIYAPEVSVTPIQESGTKIATVSVDNVDTDIYAPGVKVFIDTTKVIATFDRSTMSTLSNYEITEDCFATFRITPRTSTGFYVNIDGVSIISTWYDVASTRWYGLYLKKGQKITVTGTTYDNNNNRFGCTLFGLC